MKKIESDFTDETIVSLIVKRCITDKKFLNVFSGIYDKNWFVDYKKKDILLKIAITFFRKYNEIPNKDIIKTMIANYCKKYNTIDQSELENELTNCLELNTGASHNVIQNNIEYFIKKKGIYWTISNNLNIIQSNGNLDKCIENLDKINKISLEDNDVGLDYFSEEGMKNHWEYIMQPEATVKTLWNGIDEETHGGFLKDGRMLALFCGQAGLGKSLFLSNISTNFLKQNMSVVVISLEMSQNVYAKRFTAHISGDDINFLQNSKEHAISTIKEFYRNNPNANLIIKEYPPRTVRVCDIDNYLETLKENGHKFDAVVIDYLNLVLPNTKHDSMYESIGAVSEQLRALSYKYEVPFISATQLNRAGMNNPDVGIENISESAGQAHTADFIGILFQGEGDRENGIINMRIGKNRFGSPGKVIQFRLNPHSLVLTDQTFTMNPADDNSEPDNIINNIGTLSGDVLTM